MVGLGWRWDRARVVVTETVEEEEWVGRRELGVLEEEAAALMLLLVLEEEPDEAVEVVESLREREELVGVN